MMRRRMIPGFEIPISRHRSCEVAEQSSGPGELARSCPSSPLVKKSIRLVVVGSAGTGKTSILRRFLGQDYVDSYSPTIEDFHRKMYKIRGELYQLDIIDTGGNSGFPAARRLQLLTGDLFVVLASLDNEASFTEALRLRDEIRDLKEDRGDPERPLPILVALNKTDLPPDRHHITVKACDEKISEIGGLVPCSAKTGAGINGIFAALFLLAKLPKQMLPQQHILLSPRRSGDGRLESEEAEVEASHSPLTRLKSRRHKDKAPPVSYQEADARRPSLRTDLLVLRAKTSLPATAFATKRASHPSDAAGARAKALSQGPQKRCVLM